MGPVGNESAFLGFAGNATGSNIGLFDTGIGVNALQSLGVYAEGNTATGAWALQYTTEGSFNTATGEAALQTNTTGRQNTATGQGALNSNTTASFNTAVGYEALYLNQTGADNTATGSGALLNNVTGNNNTAVGYNAGINVTGNNNIEIGSPGTSTDSSAIRIGTAGSQTSAFIAGIYGEPTSVNDAVPVLIDSNGNLGTVSSSRRYKEDIQDMGDASRGLMRLRPVTFCYQKPFADGSQPMQYGLIAEEVAEVYPDLVAHSADGQIETVKYQLLDPMLLNEVQRQQSEMQRQQTEIRDLQERLSKMEAALAAVSQAAENR